MVMKMGLKQPDRTEKWSHPPKKKWIYNYLADGKAVMMIHRSLQH